MAKKKNKEYNDDQIRELNRILLALVTVYGPIDIEDLVDKVRHYFPKEYRYMSRKELFAMIEIMADHNGFFISEDDLVSMFSDEELDELLSVKEITAFFDSDMEKVFEDPGEILKYADIFHLEGNRELERLQDFFDMLDFKDEKDREEAFTEAVIVIYKMFDSEVYMDELQKRVKGKLDRDRLAELMLAFGGVIPRGFMHGYSLKEMGDRMKDLNLSDLLDRERLEAPQMYRKYGEYSYRECMVKAKKLMETGIFRNFCSDNLIELFINGKEIFVQLLGYYNGDRNIIIYGERDQMEYNYQFVGSEEGSYPDLGARISYSEVVMDDPEGFATPEIRFELRSKNFPLTPMIIEFDPVKGPMLAGRKKLALIGAVLDQLLEIWDQLKAKIGERCVEGNNFQIVQFYLHDDGLSVGEYTYLELGDAVVPFEVREADEKIRIKARKEIDLCIGIYAFPVQSEKRPSYVTVLLDDKTELIVGMQVDREEDMYDIRDRVIRQLEEKDLRPVSLTFNSEFTEEVLNELYEIYDLEYNYEIGDERLDGIYEHMKAVLEDPDFDDLDELPINEMIH